MPRRPRYIAPEVIQTSAMDCGPASLKCLLDGHGTHVSYGRLREACQTDLDGTSIDTIEEVAVQLGLSAEQVMVPVDHLALPEAEMLPALVVVQNPSGATHFVVVWRRHGPFVQVMDPAQGRRWIRANRLQDELYRHSMPIPADLWQAWAGSDAFLRPLAARLRPLGLRKEATDALLETARQTGTWQAYAALDAATRMVGVLVQEGGIRRGRAAERLLQALMEQATPEADTATIPEPYWSARPAAPAADGTAQVTMQGAVLVRVAGRRADAAPADAGSLSPELTAALEEAPAQPGRDLWRLLRADGLLAPAALLGALLLAAVGVLVEALLFRSLFDLTHTLGLASQRLAALGALLLFLAALLLLEWPITGGVLRLGRQLEARMRIAFLEKIPRLSDRYFQSRPVSDMAERSHQVHHLRQLPALGSGFLRTVFSLMLTTAGIIWIDPSAAPLALAVAGFSVAWPLLTEPVLAEQDLRMRSHAGALSRFYLDALLGLVAVRTHGAEPAIRREHEGLLVEWARASLRLQKTLVGAGGAQKIVGFGLVAWLLFDHVRQGEVGTVLLLVYWALSLPMLGQALAQYVHQYPGLRNTTLRLLEPLGSPETDAVASTASTDSRCDSGSTPGVSLEFDGVRVVAGGHVILDAIDLQMAAGEQVAIVGPSGAGKSSLAGLLLGWHRAAAGRVRVDGKTLDGTHLDALRAQTAWVDPSVQLWNAPLFENLCYASDAPSTALGEALAEADLRGVLHRLPDGLQTALGESGACVSGGEGQRVRFGRALLQTAPRLVILDEPFRGLDHAQRRTLLNRARHHWRDATLLCITHDIADTLSFERVLVIEGGNIVEDGKPALLARQPSRYRTLLEQDRRARHALWADAGWRRLRLSDGTLTEHAALPDAAVMPDAALMPDAASMHEPDRFPTNGYLHASYLADRTAS